MEGGGRIFSRQSFGRGAVQLQRSEGRVANVYRYGPCQRTVLKEQRRAIAHREIASSCPPLCSHVLGTTTRLSNGAAVKLPGTLTPLPAIDSSAQASARASKAEELELQQASAVGPRCERSAARDGEIAEAEEPPGRPLLSETSLPNLQPPASSRPRALAVLAAAVMASQSHRVDAGTEVR
jgi:hypothetical protein